MSAETLEDVWRRVAPRVVSAVVRRYGDLAGAEDACQEALLAAARQWPVDGTPADPQAWLIRVASRRLVDQRRSDTARDRRERAVAAAVPDHELLAPAADAVADEGDGADERDDTLTLLMLCCHPALSDASRVALTLRAVGGLTTAEIAHAFWVPEATMAQRISRAKQAIARAGARFEVPEDERDERLRATLHVLYLVFNEGYTASAGDRLTRVDLTREAIRLARAAHALRPGDGEVAGLLALMLLTEARRPARATADGRLVPLADQDRTRWDRALIQEGTALLTDALTRTPLGPYQVQAAIAAVHAEATDAADTDWRQVLGLYHVLEQLAPGPVVTLNRAVATAMVDGPAAGLAILDRLADDPRAARQHRLPAVRAHLLELAGEPAAARAAYLEAARLTTSLPEQRYLLDRAQGVHHA